MKKNKYLLKSDHVMPEIANENGGEAPKYVKYLAGTSIELTDDEAMGLTNKVKKYVNQDDVPKNMSPVDRQEFEEHHIIVVSDAKASPPKNINK